MSNKSFEVSDYYLERYLLGELTEELKHKVEIALKQDPQLRARLDALKESDEALLSPDVVDDMLREIKRKSPVPKQVRHRKDSFHWLNWVGGGALAMMVVASVMVTQYIPVAVDSGFSVEEGIRLKGLQPKLVLYKQTQDGIRELENNTLARVHERLQLSYISAEAEFGIIFSIDGNGQVTYHLPSDIHAGTKSPRLNNSEQIFLPYSYELDDAPGFERFIFVTAAEAFSLSMVKEEAENLAKTPDEAMTALLQLNDGFQQNSFLVLK